MNTTMPTIRTPQDLLSGIPALVGFYPNDSMVAVVTKDTLIYVTARADLADVETPGGQAWLASRLTHDHNGTRMTGLGIYLVGYGDRRRVRAVLDALKDMLGGLVRAALVVDGDRWWEADAPDGIGGKPVPRGGRFATILAEGRSVEGSRADLVASIAPIRAFNPDAVAVAVFLVPDDPAEAGAHIVGLMKKHASGEVLTDEDYLSAAVAAQTGDARDHVWDAIPDKPSAEEFLPFWTTVMSRVPTSLMRARLDGLAVTGMVAWIAGEGALMNVCLEEAEQADTQHPLVAMLEHISQVGLPPSAWDDLKSTLMTDHDTPSLV